MRHSKPTFKQLAWFYFKKGLFLVCFAVIGVATRIPVFIMTIIRNAHQASRKNMD